MPLFPFRTPLLVAGLCCATLVVAASAVSAADVVVIPLHGRVGIDLNARDHQQQTIDARFLEAMLDAAASENPLAIVFDIESTEGDWRYLPDMLELIVNQRASAECVAYIRNARGPASLLALTCDRIITHPTAQFGGLRDKLADATILRLRSYVETASQPRPLTNAAIDASSTLWRTDDGEFLTGDSRPTPRMNGRQIASRNDPLHLTGMELIDFGIVTDAAVDVSAAVQTLGSRLHVQSLDDPARRAHAQRKTRVRAVLRQYENLRDGLHALPGLIGATGASNRQRDNVAYSRAIRDFRTELRRVRSACSGFTRMLRNERFPIDLPVYLECQVEQAQRVADDLFALVDSRGDDYSAGRANAILDRLSWKKCLEAHLD